MQRLCTDIGSPQRSSAGNPERPVWGFALSGEETVTYGNGLIRREVYLHPPLPLICLLPVEQVRALVVCPQRLPQIHRRQHQENEAQHIPAVVLARSANMYQLLLLSHPNVSSCKTTGSGDHRGQQHKATTALYPLLGSGAAVNSLHLVAADSCLLSVSEAVHPAPGEDKGVWHVLSSYVMAAMNAMHLFPIAE